LTDDYDGGGEAAGSASAQQDEAKAGQAQQSGEKKSKKKKNKAQATAKPTARPTQTPAPAEKRWSTPITEPQEIVNYLAAYGELPENFITKKEARQLGWDSSYNYVGDVAPGKSIGGDRFGNYEGQLPDRKGRTWYECDAYYQGRKRGAHRVLYSSDGLYYYTDDHYNTFTQMYPEE